jgi:hypothetical protein
VNCGIADQLIRQTGTMEACATAWTVDEMDSVEVVLAARQRQPVHTKVSKRIVKAAWFMVNSNLINDLRLG